MKTKMILTLAFALMVAFTASANHGENDKKAQNTTLKTSLVELDNDYVQLRMMKSPEDVVKVKITRENGTVAFSDKFQTRNNVAVSYNMGDLRPGHYTVNIEKNGKLVQSYPVSSRVPEPCTAK